MYVPPPPLHPPPLGPNRHHNHRDEYGQVKSVKLLRRGRRLQQAEYVPFPSQAFTSGGYVVLIRFVIQGCLRQGPSRRGRYPPFRPFTASKRHANANTRLFRFPVLAAVPIATCVSNAQPFLPCRSHPHALHPSFFVLFPIGPVIEPHEFVTRFIASQNGKSDSLGITGRLLAMSLVVWASSFGIDENGQSMGSLDDHLYQYQEHKVDVHDQFDTDASAKLRTERRTRTNEMVKEMLYLIDLHGILRKPSWDGVRVLLMILPLAQGERSRLLLFVLPCSTQWRSCPILRLTDVQSNLERLVSIFSSISELPTTYLERVR